MPKVLKNTLLNYIPKNFETEQNINPARVFDVNDKPLKGGNVVYLCERELRVKDNFALLFGMQKSKELNLPLKIIHPKINFEYKQKQQFIERQIAQAEKMFLCNGFDFQIINQTPLEFMTETKTALLICDFNPILKRDYLKKVSCKTFEIDGHNIIPARFASDKKEYGAVTLRRKIYFNICEFLTEFDNFTDEKTEADFVLEDFIKNKLQFYAEFKNNPSEKVLSGLSKYLNLGFISGQRVALEIIKSDTDEKNKETFLEELVIRKELADNFCLYAESFKDFSDIPEWAKLSLDFHRYDMRSYIYSLSNLENAQTHDMLWNSTQMQLKREGVIHGYLRMYWAKKILEWTSSPYEALKTAIYFNDKYAYDAPSASGYAGILWAIGGLHDRAFADYPVTGKIRRMTYNSIKRKYDLSDFLC